MSNNKIIKVKHKMQGCDYDKKATQFGSREMKVLRRPAFLVNRYGFGMSGIVSSVKLSRISKDFRNIGVQMNTKDIALQF